MFDGNRVARKHEVAVAAQMLVDIELEAVVGAFQVFREQHRLVVETRALVFAVHLLQADDVRLVLLDDLDDTFDTVKPVASSDAFVDVVAQDSHDAPSPQERPTGYSR